MPKEYREEMEDTIYAPSSAVGGVIAVLRVSGPETKRVFALLGRDLSQTPRELRHALLRCGGELVDDCMAAFFPAPHSYTGEDMAELSVHGGTQTVQKALAALASLGFRQSWT